MPSIFEVMKRIIQGKPVFDATAQQPGMPSVPGQAAPLAPGQEQPAQPGQPESTIQKGNASTYPVVCITRTTTRLDGDDIQLYCYIINNCNQAIELYTINLLGKTEKLECGLAPGAERELLVYEGPNLVSAPAPLARLAYKTEEGEDYFEADHDVRYVYNADKTYTINELRLHLPIRDIYG